MVVGWGDYPERFYRAGHDYAKAGVILLVLQPASQCQQVLELGPFYQDRLMRALDAVNDRFGRGPLRLGSAGLCQGAGSALDHALGGPPYITCWDVLLGVMSCGYCGCRWCVDGVIVPSFHCATDPLT